MCLAVPGKVVEIKGDKAIVDFGGIKREVIVSLLENVQIGEYVIVHAGFAIERLNEEEAKETLRLLDEMTRLSE
ncbi:MAG: HypC/HybG/HupF family hydrogenase formation chaperone [Candidatus Asgardarchaeum californiense]|nr:MAG: HypC/HybG/HupF family hydrogenase formation chaperone [Candidatus Asgardarchaeum californiense]